MSSTLGYELFNEPPLCGATWADEQNFNTWMSEQIRTLSSKIIVYDPPYVSNTQQSEIKGTSPANGVKPIGISNLVLGPHEYNMNTISSDFAGWAAVGLPVFIGEWAVSFTTVNRTTADTYIANFYAAAKQYDFASTYWQWGPEIIENVLPSILFITRQHLILPPRGQVVVIRGI